MDDKWNRIKAAVENCIADFLALRERVEEPRDAVEAKCMACRYHVKGQFDDICDDCDIDLKNWEAKPAEEREPEEGDLVAYPFKANPKEIASVFFYEQKNDLKGTFYTDIAGPPIVLMRRAEVEARVKGA